MANEWVYYLGRRYSHDIGYYKAGTVFCTPLVVMYGKGVVRDRVSSLLDGYEATNDLCYIRFNGSRAEIAEIDYEGVSYSKAEVKEKCDALLLEIPNYELDNMEFLRFYFEDWKPLTNYVLDREGLSKCLSMFKDNHKMLGFTFLNHDIYGNYERYLFEHAISSITKNGFDLIRVRKTIPYYRNKPRNPAKRYISFKHLYEDLGKAIKIGCEDEFPYNGVYPETYKYVEYNFPLFYAIVFENELYKKLSESNALN